MNNLNLYIATLLLPVTIVVTGCSPKGPTPLNPASPITPVPAPAPPKLDGSSSGGGSFADESSKWLLTNATEELMRDLKSVSAQALPPNAKVDQLLGLLKKVDLQPNTPAYRYGRELMFDNSLGKSVEESKIIATSLFFRAHASVPVNSISRDRLSPFINEIKLKLLHELAHVLEIGLTEETDGDARKFAKAVLYAFEMNNLICVIQDPVGDFPYQVDPETEKFKEFYLLINRASGEGMLRFGIGSEENLLLAGKPIPKRKFVPDYETRENYSTPFPSRANGPFTVMDWLVEESIDSKLTYQFSAPDGSAKDRLVLEKKDTGWTGAIEIEKPKPGKYAAKCVESMAMNSPQQ